MSSHTIDKDESAGGVGGGGLNNELQATHKVDKTTEELERINSHDTVASTMTLEQAKAALVRQLMFSLGGALEPLARGFANSANTPAAACRLLPETQVEQALNETGYGPLGLGRYQWCIFFLCGFGYFLDLLWAQAFGLILGPLAQELGVPTENQGDIFTAFSTGLCVGAFTWGVLVDLIGRKWAFNLTCLITAIWGLVIGVFFESSWRRAGANDDASRNPGAPSNYDVICVFTAFCGFGLGGNIPIDATIFLEFVPVKRRWLLVALSMFQPLGVVIAWGLVPRYSCDAGLEACSAVAAGEACCERGDNMGWRYLMFTLGAITLFCFFIRFFLFNFRESPKYLVTRGRDAEAIDVVHKIAAFNKVESTISLESFNELARKMSDDSSSDVRAPVTAGAVLAAHRRKFYDMSHLKLLFSSKRMAFTTIMLFLIYMTDYWAFTVAGSFLPTILAQKGATRNISINETYRNYVIIYAPGIIGVAIGVLLTFVPRFGMKWALFVSFCLMGVSLFLFAVIDSQAANVAFSTVEYLFQSTANAVLYGTAPQLFSTAIRGTAVGTASTLGRLVSIIAPIITANLLATSGINSPLYLAGGGALLAGVFSLLLPETKNRLVY
ncbi:hypothetical protein OIO90_000881 [Microbotryomycetes sp. JL221]|nr:hypothetical protein OIO90_000881 [Microbotryomycetes sp. JL221]